MSNIGYGNHDAPPPGQTPPRQPDTKHEKPTTPNAEHDNPVATPGEGATAKEPVGKDVDPGLG